jgi:dTMP kinase
MNKESGRFVVLEGADGAGTTTQARILAHRLKAEKKIDYLLTYQPSRGTLGNYAREMMQHTEFEKADWMKLALVFAADRLDHLRHEIQPALDAGQWVICDRYVISSYVYQSLHIDEVLVQEINQYARVPDLTFFLHISPENAAARRQKRAEAEDVYEHKQFQAEIHNAYQRYTQLGVQHVGNVVSVDADREIELVSEQIWNFVGQRWP